VRGRRRSSSARPTGLHRPPSSTWTRHNLPAVTGPAMRHHIGHLPVLLLFPQPQWDCLALVASLISPRRIAAFPKCNWVRARTPKGPASTQLCPMTVNVSTCGEKRHRSEQALGDSGGEVLLMSCGQPCGSPLNTRPAGASGQLTARAVLKVLGPLQRLRRPEPGSLSEIQHSAPPHLRRQLQPCSKGSLTKEQDRPPNATGSTR